MRAWFAKWFGRQEPPPRGAAPAERATAPDERRRVEEHFNQLVAAVQDYAIFLLDAEGHIRTWNSGAERIKGYRAEEIIGRHFSVFYPKEAVASGWPAYELKEAAATGRYAEEGWRLRQDGTRFWASVTITALRDPSGEVRGYLKVTRDLTDRRRQEEKLRLSEERFRLLVEGVRDYAIFMLDPEGHVITWNAGAERINGYTGEEIIGRHFSSFYLPEDVAAHKPARELETTAATGKYEEEGWRLRKDGTRFWASVTITALRDAAGTLRGFGKVTRDLTEHKEAEETARRLEREEAARQAAEAGAAEARRLQEEERRQREQLRVTLASIGDAVIVTDTAGHVTFLNPVAEALTGWPAHEAAGQPVSRVFPIINEETRRPAEDPIQKVLRDGLTVGLANHTVLLSRDGRETPIDDSAAPIRGERGEVAGVVMVFRDVTEARRAVEDRLHLAAIVESSDDAIISMDLDGIIVSWNQAAERLYGYPAAEVVGKALTIMVPPDHPDELPALMERIKQGERVEHFETSRVRKDGSRFDVSLTISPVRNAEGKIVGASKIARDVTARKRQEAALRFLAQASSLLAELLDVTSTLSKVASLAVPQFADWCAVDLLDSEGTLQRVAVAHADAAKVALAHDLHHRYPPDPAAPVGVWNVLRTGKSELRSDLDALIGATVQDAGLRDLLNQLGVRSYIGVPLTARGRPFGVVTFVNAESGRRFDPEDLRFAEDFAHRAAIAIENARLYAALKEGDRRKDEWIAMLAHELRNPLAPIRNALQIFSMPDAPEAARVQARQMTERQLRHMVRLVDDLLDVSRIMRGKIELRKEPVDLASIIARGVETAQPLIDARGQELRVTVAPEPIPLEADPDRLAQVVANLLHNAAKFSERGKPIWLNAERQDDEAVIRVRDEGTGIAPELLPHVFDLFVQGDRSIERSEGGLGIGLTVVRKLVELHGGTISARSAGPGRGSEFIIRLPGVRAAPPAAPSPPRAAEAVSVPRRILVVDDNIDGAESLALMLRVLGHNVVLAHDGAEALRVAEAYRPDVVILDIGLPGMNGYDVARHLRERPATAQALLVAVTGYGQDEDRRRSEQAGFDEHLTKPVSAESLLGTIARHRPRPRRSDATA